MLNSRYVLWYAQVSTQSLPRINVIDEILHFSTFYPHEFLDLEYFQSWLTDILPCKMIALNIFCLHSYGLHEHITFNVFLHLTLLANRYRIRNDPKECFLFDSLVGGRKTTKTIRRFHSIHSMLPASHMFCQAALIRDKKKINDNLVNNRLNLVNNRLCSCLQG